MKEMLNSEIDLENKLKRDCPILFRENVLCGISCPFGWNNIVYEMSCVLEALTADWIKNQKVKPEEFEIPKASQIKEKFGELRYYVDFELPLFKEVITKYERMSLKTCVDCGNYPCKVAESYWKSPLCNNCEISRKEKVKNDI